MALYACGIDEAVWQLVRAAEGDEAARGALAVLGTSWASLLLLVRPFSNGLEACLLAALVLAMQRRWGLLAGAVVAAGLWTRFTFVLFAGPLVLAWLCVVGWGARVRLCGLLASGFVPAAAALVLVDRLWYGEVRLAPWNSLQYNSRAENLAAHGLHPRWLHALVNAPLLFGPLWLVFLAQLWQQRGRWRAGQWGVAASAVCGLLVLSLAPHQEVRFLLPMLLPLAALAGPRLRRTRALWLLWLLFNAALLLLFGVLHQGGVARSLLALSQPRAAASPPRHELYFHTYMPPLHLLGWPAPAHLHVHDLAGASWAELKRVAASLTTGNSSALVHVVLPGALVPQLHASGLVVAEVERFWPHLALEDVPGSDCAAAIGWLACFSLHRVRLLPSP